MFAAKFGALGANNPAGRIGTPDDVASAALFVMTNTLMTGMTLRVDGGEPLT
jgi:NAD(P)-dependent dehydrogenase (short-subunit alcohol dehydrogenase family)